MNTALAKADMTDQDLLTAYARGRNADCFGTFVERHEAAMLRFTTRLMGDRSAAEDVVQETFIRVARQPRKLIKADNCHNWLLRMARNIGIDHLRKVARRRKHTRVSAERARAQTRPAGDPAAAAVRDEQRRLVLERIAAMGPRHREVMLLRVQEQKSYREIATITGLTATHVGVLLHQAMKTLGRELGGTRQG